MKSLVYIDACMRGKESRTRRIAEPIIEHGMNLSGSSAAKGNTPSVMKHRPIGIAV